MKKVLYIINLFFLVPSINAQELETYIQEALMNNPEIQAFELRYNISSEKENEVNTIANTEIGAAYFVSNPETRTGPQEFKVSVKQMIPWFGTITARENYASSLTDVQFVELAIIKRKLKLAVAQAYYKLYAIRKKQDVLDKNIDLLNTYERLAITSVEVGKATAVDVLRLQIRQNELQQRKEVLEQDFLAEQSLFNNLLNRGESIKIEIINSLEIPVEDFEAQEELNLHPELLKFDKLYESVAKSELLNQKESSPSIGFGLDYIGVSQRPDMSFSDNGKDILMPMVTLSIPIFNSKFKSRTKQNKLKQQEVLAIKDDKKNKLKTLLSMAFNNRISSRISFDTQTKNLKQANDAERILVKTYETGTINFNDVLDVQELQLKFQINQINSVKDYYLQTAIINYLGN